MKSWTHFTNEGAQFSPTQELGLSLIQKHHKKILSVGISTAGFAEVRMALDNPQRRIVATTLDESGLAFTQKLVQKHDLRDRIELKIEDVSDELTYEQASFDFVYSRLALHYLAKDKLKKALATIHKTLSPNGECFIVVRSFDWESEVLGTTYDETTGLTTYPIFDKENNSIKHTSRHLHSVGSISSALENVGFKIKSVKLFSEKIFRGYVRILENQHSIPSKLIALHATKN